ncbi:SCO2522 family protein [Dactylosporangium vinaceum]|uniref:SCO2522 family protein n=1 Tax=Dactylosporangium vinaceum TaxID=53362 RepID=A0ABV5MSS6_9ACTN|nr:SCO2522 family protein [Dactylosporangium vinaceum]
MTTTAEMRFRETVAERGVASVPLSHVSIELGHFYAEDFKEFRNDPALLRRHFERVAPRVQAARLDAQRRSGSKRLRVSTCFLIDDYFTPFGSPSEVIPLLIKEASHSGLTIDYLARESGCAVADGVPVADLVMARIVDDPPPGTNGSRPPASLSGWLCNGQRSPSFGLTAMDSEPDEWQPPTENAASRHAIFVDVQLWSSGNGKRLWSCPFLAAVWQLLRLGLLRDQGLNVAQPRLWTGDLPTDWSQLPAVTQLNEDADPFAAYRTESVLGSGFLSVELAVRTILSQVSVEKAVQELVAGRARKEGLDLPDDVVDRIGYAFHS